MTAQIEQIENLTYEQFVENYLTKNKPFVAKNNLTDVDLQTYWTPDYLERYFGNKHVQVYNDYFDLTNIMTFGNYIKEYFGKDHAGSVPYVRWYSRLRDVNFVWADDVLKKMLLNWNTPEFVPTTDLVLPFSPAPNEQRDPARDLFPARGLFVSAKGARTGLHVDPWGSDAFLCQLYGKKTWRMYSPEKANLLTTNGKVVDPDNIDQQSFPQFLDVVPDYEFTIAPGDIVYVPHSWFHIVKSDTDSISFTWNFVHQINELAFIDWLNGNITNIDIEIVRYFLGEEGIKKYL